MTKGFQNKEHKHWLAVDDVFQMGQLLALLLHGNASTTLGAKEVNALNCSPELKGIIRKAVGPRSSRYGDAYEMLEGLQGTGKEDGETIRSLKGLSVVFTGPLSIRRFDATLLVLQSGGRVNRKITKGVDVVVVGGTSLHYQHGRKGKKLVAVERLNKEGANIQIIGESQFRRVVRRR